MTIARISFLKSTSDMMLFYSKEDKIAVVQKLINRGDYEIGPSIYIDGKFQGEDAAEEVFDLTNNPSREDERIRYCGNSRSLSVGDQVIVNGGTYLCLPSGWATI